MKALLALLTLGMARAAGIEPVVYQGEPADGWPQTVAVGVSDGGALVPLCTGVVVAEDVVLTAAHCLADLDVFVAAGLRAEVGLWGEEGDEVRVEVIEAVPHPEWDPGDESRGFLRDAAVLHLGEALSVPLPVLDEAPDDGWLGQELTLVGFGATGDDGAGSGTGLQVTLPVVEESPPILRLYAESAGNLCAGDSGGPAWRRVGGEDRLVGINVFTYRPDGGEGCEGGGTGTLLVDEVWDWVEAEIEGRAWRPGCGGCAAAGTGPGGSGLLAMGSMLLGSMLLGWRRRRRG